MAIALLPGHFVRRGELYHQLRAMTVAGLPLIKTLEALRRSPPSLGDRKPLDTTITAIQLGGTLSEGMRQSKGWLGPFDLALIENGERAGRLDHSFGLLERYYNERALLARKIYSGLLYPVLTLHLACFIFPLPAMLSPQGISMNEYLVRALAPLAMVYGLTLLLVLTGQSSWGKRWRAVLELACRYSPVTYLVVLGALFLVSQALPQAGGWFFNWLILGPGVAWILYLVAGAWKNLALARTAMLLDALLNAGVDVVKSWDMAGSGCGSPAISRAVAKWLPRVSEGNETPGEVLSNCGEFPELFQNLYATGEVSGQLDDTLRRLQDYHQEEGSRRMAMVAEWAPRVLYAFVALMIIKMIFALAGGYMKTIGNVIDGV